MYVRFKALCAMSKTPDGIDREIFKKGISRLAVEDQFFVDRVYSLVDEDMSDAIEWGEFLTAMSALEKGNIKTKLQFLFKIYDLDGDGLISRSDLSQMFLSSSMMEIDDVTEDLVTAFVERLFGKILGFNEIEPVPPNIKLSQKDVQTYLDDEMLDGSDIWELFGRSMLKDFKEKNEEEANQSTADDFVRRKVDKSILLNVIHERRVESKSEKPTKCTDMKKLVAFVENII